MSDSSARQTHTFVRDEDVEEALDWLRDNSQEAAAAKAYRVYCEEFRKSQKSILMKESASKNVSAQERDAYAHPKYLEHLRELQKAVYQDELMRAKRARCELVIEAWRTQEANYRAIKL